MTREKPTKSDFKDQNIEREEMRKNYLENFKKFAAYSDDLPSEKLEPDNPNYHSYKCRNNFWTAISGRIQNLLKENFITRDAAIECQNFIERADKKINLKKEVEEPAENTTPEQIKDINSIIQLVIKELKKTEDKTEQDQ